MIHCSRDISHHYRAPRHSIASTHPSPQLTCRTLILLQSMVHSSRLETDFEHSKHDRKTIHCSRQISHHYQAPSFRLLQSSSIPREHLSHSHSFASTSFFSFPAAPSPLRRPKELLKRTACCRIQRANNQPSLNDTRPTAVDSESAGDTRSSQQGGPETGGRFQKRFLLFPLEAHPALQRRSFDGAAEEKLPRALFRPCSLEMLKFSPSAGNGSGCFFELAQQVPDPRACGRRCLQAVT
mmetsp:Transcript_28132/g.65403  ORF Transcript_28132/g.65403 Transcript_28132/m.65403 type:complete len:239 (-) Transcript_28132:49-765(-)